MQRRLNVCVMYPNENAYSETFIHNQIRCLPEHVFPLYGGWLPFLQPGRKHILSRNPIERVHRRIRRSLFHVPQKVLIEEGLIRFLKKKRIDVVLAHYSLTAIAVLECCEKASVPLVVHFHGFDAYDFQVLRENREGYKRLFQSAARVIVVSQEMKEQILSLGCALEKVVVNACGVDTDYFSGGGSFDSPPQFVAVGRFIPVKGPTFTLQAFQRVLQEIPDATLVMVGDGELFEECKQKAREWNIAHAVKFTGPLPPENVLEILNSSRVFVQHGIKNEQVGAEGLGLAVIEASSTGLPVVVTRHGGFKESVVHGETGFLVEEGDVSGMAECMKNLALNDELCARMGKNGRERIQALFSLPQRVAALDQILRQACGID